MTTHQLSDLSSQIEHLVQDHIAACRKAAQEAVARAFDVAMKVPKANRDTPPAKAAPTVRRQSRRRDHAEIEQVSERFYQAVLANPGETMAFLAAKLGMRSQELHRPMDLLRQAKRVSSVGQRHFTKYFPMSDGDAVAA